MKISTRGRYGLRILLDLALHDNGSPRMIRDIAGSQRISEKYISRLIIDLRRAGMVKSVRGSRGGYRIARYPKNLTVLDVIEVMEGPVSIIDCVTTESCDRQRGCAVRSIWCDMNNQIRSALAAVTLQDVIDRQRENEEMAEYCL